MLPIKERPVGNQFPETNGAAPFPCLLSHSRLVFPENVRTRSRNNIMDYQHQHCHHRNHHHHHHPNQSQDDDNYLLRSVSTSFSCLQLSGSSSDIGTDTDTESSVMNQPSYMKHKSVVDICDGDNNDSGFLSTNSSSSRLSASSSPYSDSAIYANSEISVEQMNDFDEKLALFYKLCLQTKRLIKEFQVKYEGFVVNFRWEDVCAAVNLNLERLKTFRGEMRNQLGERLEQCKMVGHNFNG